MTINKKLVIQYYEYFYKKIYNKGYRYLTNTKSDQQLDVFVKNLVKLYPTASYDTLWNYFIFQFQIWDGREIENYNGSVNLNNIIGNKAILRYKERRQDQDWRFESSNLLQKYSLKKRDLVKITKIREVQQTDIVYVDYFSRKVRANSLHLPEGFLECFEYTSLYDPSDASCQKCIFTAKCKAQQKKIFPQIYKKHERK